jgi:hypothetical protein
VRAACWSGAKQHLDRIYDPAVENGRVCHHLDQSDLSAVGDPGCLVPIIRPFFWE